MAHRDEDFNSGINACCIVLGPNPDYDPEDPKSEPYVFALVKDPGKPLPHYWKFPGGQGKLGETPLQVVVREIKEELGLTISKPRLLIQIHEKDHIRYFYYTLVSDFDDLLKLGDEVEVALFSQNEIEKMAHFFSRHIKPWKAFLAHMEVLRNKPVEPQD